MKRFMLLRHDPVELRIGLHEVTDPDLCVSWPRRTGPSRLWAAALALPGVAEALEGLPEGAEILVKRHRMKIVAATATLDRASIEKLMDNAEVLADALALAAGRQAVAVVTPVDPPLKLNAART